MRDLTKKSAKITLIFLPLVYFFPKIALFYIACGIYDVSRNGKLTPELFKLYFLGDGGLPVWLLPTTWLLSPVNALLDLLSLPYINKGIYDLEDLPPAHQGEIVRLIESTRAQDLIGRLHNAASAEKRSMFFFKWYGTNVETIADVPEFHENYNYIVTIGVSVFNKKQSVSKHSGPLRATFRVLYNFNDIDDDFAYIVVRDKCNYWRENKLFIFDDTLLHESVNESDKPRYCLFVDIVRPTMMTIMFKYFVRGIGKLTSQRPNKLFFLQWKVF